MTAELLTNPIECLLLEADDEEIPEGTVTHFDVKLCNDGSAYVAVSINTLDDGSNRILLQVDKDCIKKIDEQLYQCC